MTEGKQRGRMAFDQTLCKGCADTKLAYDTMAFFVWTAPLPHTIRYTWWLCCRNQLFRSNAGYRLRFATAVDAHRHGKSESRPGLTPDSIAAAQLATDKRGRAAFQGPRRKQKEVTHQGCDFSHDKSHLVIYDARATKPGLQNSVSPLPCELGDAAFGAENGEVSETLAQLRLATGCIERL